MTGLVYFAVAVAVCVLVLGLLLSMLPFDDELEESK